MDEGERFAKWSGAAVAAGGVVTFGINAGLTPLLESDAPFAETAASTVFFWRQSASAIAALLLLFGSVGLYLRHAKRAGVLGAIAFALVFVGNALLFANEWAQVVFVRGLALATPEALNTLDGEQGMSSYDIGSLTAFAGFTLGWILFSVSMLRSGAYARRGPILVILGFFATPILGAVISPALGAAAGSGVLAAGWLAVGRELFQTV